MKFKNLLLTLLVGSFAVSANANTIVSTSSLQDGLDAITEGGSFLDVNVDQYMPDEVWTVDASGSAANRLLFEFASFEATAKFGIYDLTDRDNRVLIFDGAACGTADTTCTPGLNNVTLTYDSGTGLYESVLVVSPYGLLDSGTFGSGRDFGYYIDSGEGTFYSVAGHNTDVADDDHDNTTDHMVAFRGDGSIRMDITGGTSYSTLGTNEYILAFEDLEFPTADYDYSDLVVLVESVSPVPEPSILALLGLGLLGLGVTRRRRISA